MQSFNIISQRYCLRTKAWQNCPPHKAQAWLVRRDKLPLQRFANKSAAYSYIERQERLAAPAPRQTLNQRYDTSAYRGAIFSTKPQPTAKVKGDS